MFSLSSALPYTVQVPAVLDKGTLVISEEGVRETKKPTVPKYCRKKSKFKLFILFLISSKNFQLNSVYSKNI